MWSTEKTARVATMGRPEVGVDVGPGNGSAIAAVLQETAETVAMHI